MLAACKYCGRIHAKNYDCGRKPKRRGQQMETEAILFRRSWRWTKKSKEIRERDNHLCQVCLRERHNSTRPLQWEDISVHHIVPIAEDETRALDNFNLITLCGYHHELAEAGKISKNELFCIANEQEMGADGQKKIDFEHTPHPESHRK